MEKKIYRGPLVLKAEGEGEAGSFRAEFATLNVVDWHTDVTEPGAFQNGQEVIIEPWNHGWDLPSGKGVVQSDDQKAWVDGKFFLDTQAGMETYKTVKNLGGLAEWSYSFDILDSGEGTYDGQRVRVLRKLDVVGVGPVTRGAGIDTRTVMIKRQAKAGEDGEGGGDDAGGKPSGPDAELMTQILISEIGIIAGGLR